MCTTLTLRVRERTEMENLFTEEEKKFGDVQIIKLTILHFSKEKGGGGIIVRQSQRVPIIILYTEDQINDLKRFCCPPHAAQSTALDIGKTHNLSDVHVTVTVYRIDASQSKGGTLMRVRSSAGRYYCVATAIHFSYL